MRVGVGIIVGIALVLESSRIFLLPFFADLFVTAAMNSRPGLYSTQLFFLPSLLASIMSSVSLGLLLWAVFSLVRQDRRASTDGRG